MIGLPKWYLYTNFEVDTFREKVTAWKTVLSMNCYKQTKPSINRQTMATSKKRDVQNTAIYVCLYVTVMGTLDSRENLLQIATVQAQTHGNEILKINRHICICP